MIQSVSWNLSKFAVNVLSGKRPRSHVRQGADEPDHGTEPQPDTSVQVRGEGRYTLESYTVSYRRSGEPQRAVVVGRTPSGERVFAVNETDEALIGSMTREEPIGKNVTVTFDERIGLNCFLGIES